MFNHRSVGIRRCFGARIGRVVGSRVVAILLHFMDTEKKLLHMLHHDGPKDRSPRMKRNAVPNAVNEGIIVCLPCHPLRPWT